MGDEKNELIPLLIIHINESQPIFPALFSPGPNKRGIWGIKTWKRCSTRPKIPVTTRLLLSVRNKDPQKNKNFTCHQHPGREKITSSYITYMYLLNTPFSLHVLHHQLTRQNKKKHAVVFWGTHLGCHESIKGISQLFDHLLVLIQLLQILHFWGHSKSSSHFGLNTFKFTKNVCNNTNPKKVEWSCKIFEPADCKRPYLLFRGGT